MHTLTYIHTQTNTHTYVYVVWGRITVAQNFLQVKKGIATTTKTQKTKDNKNCIN